MQRGKKNTAVSWLRQLVTIFAAWRTRFSVKPVHVGLVVGKVAL